MSWEKLPDLAVARSHPAVAVHGGRLYAIGGGGPAFASLDAVEVFDAATEQWRPVRPMPTKRSGAMAVSVGDRIAVIGGGFKKPDGKFRFLRIVELYDPAADRWSDGPEMFEPHDYPACAVLDGRIYIVTGHHPGATEGGPQTDPGFSFAERWHPEEDAWESLPPAPTARFAASALALGGRVAVAGGVAFTPNGFTEFDCVELYDPPQATWERAAWSLPWTAAAHTLAVVGRRLVLCGGFSGDVGIGATAAVCDLDAADRPGAWRRVAPLPEPRAAAGSAVLDGRLMLVGGWAADRSVLPSVRAWRDE